MRTGYCPRDLTILFDNHQKENSWYLYQFGNFKDHQIVYILIWVFLSHLLTWIEITSNDTQTTHHVHFLAFSTKIIIAQSKLLNSWYVTPDLDSHLNRICSKSCAHVARYPTWLFNQRSKRSFFASLRGVLKRSEIYLLMNARSRISISSFPQWEHSSASTLFWPRSRLLGPVQWLKASMAIVSATIIKACFHNNDVSTIYTPPTTSISYWLHSVWPAHPVMKQWLAREVKNAIPTRAFASGLAIAPRVCSTQAFQSSRLVPPVAKDGWTGDVIAISRIRWLNLGSIIEGWYRMKRWAWLSNCNS